MTEKTNILGISSESAALPLGQKNDRVNLVAEIEKYTEYLYREIVRLDLSTGCATVLHSVEREHEGYDYNWDDYLKWYVSHYISPEDRKRMLDNFGCANIRDHLCSGINLYSLDFNGKTERAAERVTVLAYHPNPSASKNDVCLMVRKAGEDHILKSIVDMYVYDNSDYFMYLDAPNNSYTMFSTSSSGTPLPPVRSSDFMGTMEACILNYVVPEDQAHVIAETRLPRIESELEKHGVHTFTMGVLDPERGYTRKCMEFRYHDREHGIILLSRIDVTPTYLEEKKHAEELHAALLRAQTDPLTKLWNIQSTMDQVNERLASTDRPHAFLFMDMDNFKTVNDSMGHAAGDRLLRSVANILKKHTEGTDIAGRVGGDEFIFFSDRANTREKAEAVASSICADIRTLSSTSDIGQLISCSIGIAMTPIHGADYRSVSSAADRAAYRAKKAGKNRYSF